MKAHHHTNEDEYDKITTIEDLEAQEEGSIVFPSNEQINIQSTQSDYFDNSENTIQELTSSEIAQDGEWDFHLDTLSFIPK